MSVLGLLMSLFGCSRREIVERVTSGPFEIEMGLIQVTGSFNIGIFATRPATNFRVKYKGKPVTLKRNGETLDTFEEALFLEGTPQPTVLFGYKFLATEGEGRLKVEEIPTPNDPNETAAYQWLDAEQGQPAPEVLVGVAADRRGEHARRSFSGGSLLLISERTVLDVHTLRSFVFPQFDFDTIQKQLHGYGPPSGPALSLSPSQRQIVFAASRPVDGDYSKPAEWALLAVQFATGTIQVVPFDAAATHFERGSNTTADWIVRHVQWAVQGDGSERLTVRSGQQ